MHTTTETHPNPFLRTEWLLGAEALDTLKKSRVALFGVGGVGSYAAEALARCGVGVFSLIDHDTVDITNLNRQIHALHSTVGMLKTEAMRKRIMDINPNARVYTYPIFFAGGPVNDPNGPSVPASQLSWDYDYVIDAVDTVTAKIQIILAAQKLNIPVVSAMGAGNKLDPSGFKAADIYETNTCPLAKVMRQLCRKHQIKKLRVVFSAETPIKQEERSLGSIAFVPAAAGLVLAGEAVKGLIGL